MGGFKKGRRYPFVDVPTILWLVRFGRFKYVDYNLGFYRKHINSTWLEYARNTEKMGREILKQEILYITNNTDLNIKHNLERILQESAIKYSRKTFSLIAHWYINSRSIKELILLSKVYGKDFKPPVLIWMLYIVFILLFPLRGVLFEASYRYSCF